MLSNVADHWQKLAFLLYSRGQLLYAWVFLWFFRKKEQNQQIMFTVGSVGQCHWLIYQLPLGPYVGQVSSLIGHVLTDTRQIYLLTVGRVSVEYWLSVGQVTVKCWFGIGWETTDILTNTRPIVDRYIGRILAMCRLSVSQNTFIGLVLADANYSRHDPNQLPSII